VLKYRLIPTRTDGEEAFENQTKRHDVLTPPTQASLLYATRCKADSSTTGFTI